MSKHVAGIIVAALTVTLCGRIGAAQEQGQKPFLIASFEPGAKEAVALRTGSSTIVHDKEKASDGEYCVRVESSKDAYTGIDISDKAVLKHFKDYMLFKMDVYNPQSEPISIGITMLDPASTSWGTKHNGTATAAPGKSTVEVNLTGLNRSNGKWNMSTDLVDPAKPSSVSIFMCRTP